MSIYSPGEQPSLEMKLRKYHKQSVVVCSYWHFMIWFLGLRFPTFQAVLWSQLSCKSKCDLHCLSSAGDVITPSSVLSPCFLLPSQLSDEGRNTLKLLLTQHDKKKGCHKHMLKYFPQNAACVVKRSRRVLKLHVNVTGALFVHICFGSCRVKWE